MNKQKFCYHCNAHYHHVRNACIKCNRTDTHRVHVIWKIAFFSMIVISELYFFEILKV